MDFPPNIRVYSVVSVQQVEPARDPARDPWRRDFPRPPPVDADEYGEIFEAEIVGHRVLRSSRKKYRIHWVGYPIDQDQWVSDLDVTDALVEEYD